MPKIICSILSYFVQARGCLMLGQSDGSVYSIRSHSMKILAQATHLGGLVLLHEDTYPVDLTNVALVF